MYSDRTLQNHSATCMSVPVLGRYRITTETEVSQVVRVHYLTTLHQLQRLMSNEWEYYCYLFYYCHVLGVLLRDL
jgi:hypothetical protein